MATQRRSPHGKPRPAAQQALTEAEIDELQQCLDSLPAPLEPLDVSALDGFVCGVLLQPRRISEATWWPHVVDADGRALPAGIDAGRAQALVRRRHAELDAAIQARQWFDPWVFELDGEDASPSEAVVGWVAGFALAMELFPALMALDAQALREPLALLYRHLEPDDLEDADELLEEIESLEPPEDLAEAVEDLVRATLLLADVSRPLPAPRRR
jgi:uncharacterized protein